MPPTLAHRLTALLRLRVVIPVLLTAALLAFAFSITSLPSVMGSIEAIPLSTWLLCIAFAALYLLLKGLEFHLFLKRLGLCVPWSSFLLAYAVGELSITIPSGIYAQNYVLKKVRAVSFLRSAAATTAVLVIEGTLILFTLLVLRIPGWGWLQPLILSVFAAAAVLLAVARRADYLGTPRTTGGRRGRWMRLLALGLRKMIGDLRRLLSPQALIPGTLLALGYLGALVGAFLAVAHGVGVPGLTFVQAATIYFFSLSVMMALGGLLTQVGVMEVVGLSAAQAWGYDLNKGLAMLLGFRIVWTAGVWLLSCPPVLALHAELSRGTGDDLEKPGH